MSRFLAFGVLAFACTAVARAGPPYLTDDPEPVPYRHYEIYVGYEALYQPGNDQSSIPFAEVNYGPFPNVQIAGSFPLSYATAANGSMRYGAGDLDFGIKYRFVQESATTPQVSFYPSASG